MYSSRSDEELASKLVLAIFEGYRHYLREAFQILGQKVKSSGEHCGLTDGKAGWSHLIDKVPKWRGRLCSLQDDGLQAKSRIEALEDKSDREVREKGALQD